MSAAILVSELRVHYRQKKGGVLEAVKGLSFQVEPGEVVGFLGPNGAGKSSTLKALMGFVIPSSGQCQVFGHPAGTIAAKTRMGYLPEIANYYPYLTPLETLRLYGELQGLSGQALIKESKDLLEQVGVGHAVYKQNRTMSKGMLQRVGIAQSMLGSPELLVLDEVTSGLDPIGRQELRALLRERQQAGCTLLFSSHELAEVEMLCDRILVIHQGQLIEERELPALKDELRQYRLLFIGGAPMVGLTDILEEQEDGSVLAQFECKHKLLEAIERVNDSKGRILDVIAQEGSLEDYFIRTIARAA